MRRRRKAERQQRRSRPGTSCCAGKSFDQLHKEGLLTAGHGSDPAVSGDDGDVEQDRILMLCIRYGGEASVSHVTLSLDGNKVMATLQEFARDYVDDAALLQDAIQAVKDDAGPGRVLSSLTWHSYMKVAGEAGGKMDMHGDSNLGYSRRYVVRGCEGGGESYMSFAYVGYERPEDMYRVSIPSGHAIVAGPELLARPATHIMHGVESVHRHTYSMIVDFKEQTSN